MLVNEIMCRDVATCDPEESLEAPARIMWERDCGVVPVVSGGALVGIITDRDIAMGAWTKGRALHDIPVRSVMAKEVVTCRPGASVTEAEELMRKNQIRRLPVTLDGKLVGLVSLADIARANEQRRRRQPDREAGDEVAVTLASVCAPRRDAAPPAAPTARPDGKAGRARVTAPPK